MKKLYLLLFLAFFVPHAHAQNSQERCQQGSCSGFGPPIGACVGSFIYSDISQSPVQAYSCVAGAWGKQGGGGTLANPLTVTAEWPFNDGTGTLVRDITGNGHDGTFCTGTSAPTWGNNGVQFLTALTFPQCVTTNVTTFGTVLIAYEVFANPTTTGIAAPSGPYANNPMIFGPPTSTGGVGIMGAGSATAPQDSGAFSPASFYAGVGGAGAGVVSNTSNGFGQRHILAFTPSAGVDKYYIDGAPISAAGASSLADVITTSFYQFGWATNNGNRFLGTIQYAVVSPALTDAQVILETNYIQSQLNLRALVPYTLATTKVPTIVLGGDSLWAGSKGTQVWSNLLTLNNTYASPASNHGIGGQMASDVANLAESTWLPSVSPSAKTYVLLEGGINDLAKSTTAANIWASRVAAVNKARSAGAIPICSTIISQTGSDAAIAPVNALIRGNWKLAGCAALLDNAERPEFAAGGSTNTTFYQTDGTHLTGLSACSTSTGYGLFCVGASKVINTLDGSNQTNPDQSASNAFVETDANSYIIQTPTAAATHQLVDCSWITGLSKTIANGSATNTITVSSTASQVITGSTSVLPNTTAVFTVVGSSPTAGGCFWLRTQ